MSYGVVAIVCLWAMLLVFSWVYEPVNRTIIHHNQWKCTVADERGCRQWTHR